jgi:ArsR family transcriptional regulator, arsenate/arsenite/antimonite-responsive transcriptional repressor
MCQATYNATIRLMARPPKPFSLTNMFRALEDTTRLRILNLIGDQEICVCYFVEALRIDQPKVSRHLAYLRRANLVSARKEGKWVHYRISIPSDPRAARVLRDTLEWAAHQPEFQRDQARLAAARCCATKMVTIREAPALATVRG